MFSWGSKIFKNPNLEFLGKLNLKAWKNMVAEKIEERGRRITSKREDGRWQGRRMNDG